MDYKDGNVKQVIDGLYTNNFELTLFGGPHHFEIRSFRRHCGSVLLVNEYFLYPSFEVVFLNFST